MGLKGDIRRFEEYAKIRKYCPYCGHTNSMPIQLNSKICGWCGKKIYRTKEAEFKDKFNVARIKENKK